MPCEKVGVKVRQKDVADMDAEPLGIVQILLDITLWVDDDGGMAGLVGQQVRGVGETAEIVLLEEHGAFRVLPKGGREE
jgi:hypothetical protein